MNCGGLPPLEYFFGAISICGVCYRRLGRLDLLDKIIIAVGSTRRPKVNAVWDALKAFGGTLGDGAEVDVAAVEVPSGVRHTPLSREDMMAGARQRAEALVRIARAQNEPWRYFVGLEGGLDVILDGGEKSGRRVFLENWAYVTDGNGRGAFGQSGAIALPEALAKIVVDDGVELAEAVDAFTGGRGIRDAQGAWGVLTRNVITRQDAFRTAVINAFAPFFNRTFYVDRA
jgi:inosine/xanthosine triphosphatase